MRYETGKKNGTTIFLAGNYAYFLYLFHDGYAYKHHAYIYIKKNHVFASYVDFLFVRCFEKKERYFNE